MYIIKHKFGMDGDICYYLKIEDKVYHECYNINEATQFVSAEEAKKWIKINSTMDEYSKVVLFDREKKKFDKWWSGGSIRRTLEIIDKTYSRKYNGENGKELIDWWFNHDGNNIKYEHYATWPKLYDKFNYIFDSSFYINHDTNEVTKTVSVRFYKNTSNLESFIDELNLVLPFITLKEKDCIVVDVFDYHLSEHGDSCSLIIHSDGDWSVKGRFYNQKKSKPKKIFDALCKDRYYE